MEIVNQALERPVVAYFVILILTGIVYKVAFARPLPPLKALVVYLFLALGCFLLLLFHMLQFPIVPILVISVVLIGVARIRMAASERKSQTDEQGNGKKV
ncbi:MAG: YlaH-like family protein [Planifilum fulgidum]|jgi:predicted membrane channel-forming protein YqfA (hemolysin III family)